MDCLLRSFDYKEYRRHGGKFMPAGAVIGLRSNLMHSELQFSGRRYGVSVSATKMDGADGVRIKRINYSNATKWWTTKRVPMDDEQEDAVFEQALRDSGVSHGQFERWIGGEGGCLYGKMHIKYDFYGCGLSFVFPDTRIWRPSNNRVWCSEEDKNLIVVAHPFYGTMIEQGKCKRSDETTPEILDAEIGVIFHE